MVFVFGLVNFNANNHVDIFFVVSIRNESVKGLQRFDVYIGVDPPSTYMTRYRRRSALMIFAVKACRCTRCLDDLNHQDQMVRHIEVIIVGQHSYLWPGFLSVHVLAVV